MIGLGGHRLSPDVFWRMSLVEWRALTEEPSRAGIAALSRAEFQALATRHPDRFEAGG